VIVDNQSISILIVEDHDDTRDGLTAFLSTEYTCFAAATAEEAMRLLVALPFDLVLTDIHLPGASGFEVCRLIARMGLDTVVMVMTGMTDIGYRLMALDQGAWYCIEKPLDPDKLLVWVKTALRCQEVAREKQRRERQVRPRLKTFRVYAG
jgi:DNA-binding response OmpR family regulator